MKPKDEELAKTEEGFREYLDHCLYVGAMPLENARKTDLYENAHSDIDILEEDVDLVYDFPAPRLEDRGTYNYNSIWSPQLVK